MAETHVPAELSRMTRDRANGICEYCRSQERFSPQRFSVEHIKPQSAGGASTPANLALSCQGCNGHKYTKQQAPDPVTRRIVPLFHPRRQRWSDHFAWGADGSLIVGVTSVGRATVEALRMNRIELVNLREVLYAAQQHPPAEPDTPESFVLGMKALKLRHDYCLWVSLFMALFSSRPHQGKLQGLRSLEGGIASETLGPHPSPTSSDRVDRCRGL